MNVTKTFIEGVLILEPAVHKDRRGFVYESFRENEYNELCGKFVQDNISLARKNVLKGLHYSKHQSQLIGVAYGEIYDVVTDLRKNSKTFKRHFSIQLNSDNPKQIYMPNGCAHGLYVLSDLAVISYKCSRYYDISDDLSIRWDDQELNINWPISSGPIVSDKDSKAEMFANVQL
ncbi:MAG: dTDP-4-dehydrorhamnose 3,5-epimerase [Holosporales bacterium]|jgi:dTDP-4-dehydrorhamnose 3,5-epimerase|nr:dTDP-4-dehydrorhamnose 3,5-epimerase [Holosporales bacterium]